MRLKKLYNVEDVWDLPVISFGLDIVSYLVRLDVQRRRRRRRRSLAFIGGAHEGSYSKKKYLARQKPKNKKQTKCTSNPLFSGSNLRRISISPTSWSSDPPLFAFAGVVVIKKALSKISRFPAFSRGKRSSDIGSSSLSNADWTLACNEPR